MFHVEQNKYGFTGTKSKGQNVSRGTKNIKKTKRSTYYD